MGENEPGWYNVGDGQLRYKDGEDWTDQYRDIDSAAGTSDVGPHGSPSQGAPAAQVTRSVRSTKLVGLVSGIAALIILAAIGVYFVALRSLPSTVSWAPSASAMVPGGVLTVSGVVNPAESGRLIRECAHSTRAVAADASVCRHG
jgi:hypothetical protein